MNVLLPEPTPASPRVFAGIVIGNLIPILGVLFLGWDAGAILILYWIENFIVGVFTLPRILFAQGPAAPAGSAIGGTPLAERVFMAAFFCVHYGMFWVGHGVFALTLAASFRSPAALSDNPVGAVEALASREAAVSFLIAIGAMVVLHAFGFWREFLKTGLWRTATPGGEMFRPYGRLFVLHLTVLLGAFGLATLGAPAWTMIVLCVGKMVLELTLAGASAFRPKPVDQST